MNATELRAKSKDELRDLVMSLKQEQFNLRFQEATGALENKSRYKRSAPRRSLAPRRVMNEKPVAAKAAKAPKEAAPKKAKAAKKAKKD